MGNESSKGGGGGKKKGKGGKNDMPIGPPGLGPHPYGKNVLPQQPFIWNPGRGKWLHWKPPPAQSERAKAGLPSKFRIVTYNVWFSQSNWTQRGKALFELIEDLDPDIVAFQEVTPHFLQFLLSDEVAPWIRQKGFILSSTKKEHVLPYGNILMCRFKVPYLRFFRRELPSKQGRWLWWFECGPDPEDKSTHLAIGTIHLESLDNKDRRKEQLNIIAPLLRKAGARSMLIGDFNFDATWKDEVANLTNNDMIDCWETFGRPIEESYTEDTNINKMLQKKCIADGDPDLKQVRYDRMTLIEGRKKDAPWELRCVDMQRLGTKPIDPDGQVWISDHFGLVGDFVIE